MCMCVCVCVCVHMCLFNANQLENLKRINEETTINIPEYILRSMNTNHNKCDDCTWRFWI